MDRRSFLLSLGVAALSQGLSGCRKASVALQISLLARTLPSQLVSKFRASVKSETEVTLSIASSLQQLFTDLQQRADPKPSAAQRKNVFQQISERLLGAPPEQLAQVSTLGDYWLSVAIEQNLIRPWPLEQWQGWSTLPPQWQQIVRRDRQGQLSKTGEIWGAPYRWGATVIAYRKDKFRALGWTPTDWADLWRPELQDKISLVDQPREVIGLTLKKLKHSYNTPKLDTVPDLLPALQALNQQVKLYSSTDYLQPLLLKDTWVAVGWSTDILAVLEENSDIGIIAPQSGTALWSDVWVWPQTEVNSKEEVNASDTTLLQQWVEFWWQPDIAKALTQFTNALSPALQEFKTDSPTKQVLLPTQPWFEQSEFLEPLSAATLTQYQTLWQQMRTPQNS